MATLTDNRRNMTTGGRSRTGLILGDSRFEEEIRSFLQRRLRLLSGTVAAILVLLSLAFVATLTAAPDRSFGQAVERFCFTFPNAILFFMAVSSSLVTAILWRRRLPGEILLVLDAVFLQVLVAPTLLLYDRLHYLTFSGFAAVVPFLMLFLLARAVLIPSTAWRTLLLSAPAAVGVLVIQLRSGASYAFPDQPLSPAFHLDSLIQNQVLLWGAIAVAVTASRVHLGLRRANFDARRIGQYHIDRLLGKGGMGEVYLARHALLKRPTAVKFLRPEVTGRRNLERFEKEVRHTSRLTHPNTVTIFDYGHTAEGIFYYAMELLHGADLRRIVDATGPLPPGRVIHVLRGACGALAEAHGKNIIHRDIKPGNIMLCEQGGEQDVVKLLDFGLAHDRRDQPSEKDMVTGTPETIAPEVIRGEEAGPASDIYSLCAVGCYLLTGRPIFDATSVPGLLSGHLHGAPVSPSRRRPDVPADLEGILLQGLAKDPAARPPGAAALRDELARCRDAGHWTSAHARDWWRRHAMDIAPEAESHDDATLSPIPRDEAATINLPS